MQWPGQPNPIMVYWVEVRYKDGIIRYEYALWRNDMFLLSDHQYLIDVIRVREIKFLFWRWKSRKIVAVFKVRQLFI